MSLPLTVYPRLGLRITPHGRRLTATARGGSGSLLYVRWRVGRRTWYGPRITVPRHARAVFVRGIDGTGTVAAERLRLAHGHIRGSRVLPAGLSPLADAGPAGALCPR
jgi:hypothetical protein